MFVEKNEMQEGEWMLCFKMTKSGIKRLAWMYVNFVVPVSKADKSVYDKDYPYQAIQVHKPKHYYLSLPFKIDEGFEKAFEKAVNEYGKDKIEELDNLKPDKKLLECVKKHMPCS